MKITVAKSWQELTNWQLEEIIDLYLHHFEKEPQKTFDKMIFVLFQKKKGFFTRLKLWKIIRLVPISELYEFGEFLLQPPKLHVFPEVENLIKPADRLGDISSKHFSFTDQFFQEWISTKNDEALKRLCANIYIINENFDEQKLKDVAQTTSKLSRKKRQVIGFTYMSCYHHLAAQYPTVYPKPKEEDPEAKPKLKPQKKHTPFSEIIINMVMNEESQPLGNFHQTNNTRIYDFLNVLSKIIIKNKKAEENANRKK